MKFDELYKRAFAINEEADEIAHPDDPSFNDVEGAPVPDLGLDTSAPVDDLAPDTVSVNTGSLTDFISKLEEFSKLLNDTGESSLQSMVSRLDKVETPFDGIKTKTSSEIELASITLKRIADKLRTFIINAAKAKVG